MKKISLMFAAMVAALGFSACNETWDDNPVLGTHEGDVVKNFLNEPEMANMAVLITEENNSEAFHLTCSQPEEYGYAASVAYQVEVALNSDFTTPAVEGAPESVLLGTSFYDCAEINPTRRAIAEAMCKLLDIKDQAQVPTDYMPLYMRLRANVVNESGTPVPGTAFTSNVVSFKSVSCGYLAVVIPGQPTGIYVRGDMNGWLNDQLNDGNNLEILSNYEFLTTTESNVYELEYIEIEANVAFKIADKGWGAPNLGIGNNPIEFGKKCELGWNTDNITLNSAFKGSVTLSGSDKKWTVVFDALEPDTPGQPSGIYMRGDFNNWGTDTEFLTTDVKGVWEIASVTIPNGLFKLATSDWSTLDLGAHKADGADVAIVPGEKYALDKGGSNISGADGFSGKATLRLKAGNYTLLLEPNK
ncbi:MAG: SusE domain-containing protein [Muribaculaceae bacterium]|nr:SusE domain-containing protein [Muribaculaceae bacterium]